MPFRHRWVGTSSFRGVHEQFPTLDEVTEAILAFSQRRECLLLLAFTGDFLGILSGSFGLLHDLVRILCLHLLGVAFLLGILGEWGFHLIVLLACNVWYHLLHLP